jgi:hypothetical protein
MATSIQILNYQRFIKSHFCFWLFFTIFLSSIKAQGSDTTIIVENNDFLKQIISSKEYVYASSGKPGCILPFNEGILSEKGQIVYKTPQNLYIRLEATGFLFKMVYHNDSVVAFNRIDNTDNFNYNFGAYSFSNGEDLYNYGGYGFWKNNGTLRRYNFKTKDWTAALSDKEVINQYNPINNAWFDPIEQKLHVPFKTIVNDGLIDNEPQKGKVNDNSFILDLKTMKWQHNGNANKELLKIVRNGEMAISTKRGLMVLSHEQLYLIDFKSNKVFHLDDNIIAQFVHKLEKGQIIYHQGNLLHVYNLKTKKSDSITIELSNFIALPYPVIEPPCPYFYFIAIGIFFIGLIILYNRKMKRKTLAKKTIELTKPVFKVNFTETEIALISMLIAKSKTGLTASITEINYILGVKDKNIGMQKKVRSDIFKSINDKFNIFSNSDEILIKSIRSESDKRYYEYMIDKETIESISAFLDPEIQLK